MPIEMIRKLHTDESDRIRTYLENAIHYPTLKTVLEVEDVLKNSDEPLKKADIKRKLKTKIMHQTLNVILAYLLGRNMIIETGEGFVWIYNPRFVRKMRKGTIRVR